jgi:hypothetical protein
VEIQFHETALILDETNVERIKTEANSLLVGFSVIPYSRNP